MYKGWISLHRQIWDNWVWKDKPFSKGQAWIDLLLMANYEDKKVLIGNQLITVKRGSFVTSVRKLCDRWGWSNTKVRSFLSLLEQDGMLIVKSDAKKTTLTIVNYSDYQDLNISKNDTKTTVDFSKIKNRCEKNDAKKTVVSIDTVKLDDNSKSKKRRKNDAKTTQKHTNNNDNNINNNNKDIYNKSDSTNPTQPTEQTNRTNIAGTPQERIFRHWNSKNIIQHRKLTDKIKRAINGALQDYSEEEIYQAIDNYAVILADDRYYWSYKWGLKEFLQRGLDKFLDFDVAAQNYRKDDREKQKLNKQTDFNKFEQHEYTADELESLFMKIGGG